MTLKVPIARLVHRRLSGDGDQVVFWAPIPGEGVWMGGSIDLHCVMDAEDAVTRINNAVGIGISAYGIPLLNPDNPPTSPDGMWNEQVPKDEAVPNTPVTTSIIDVDTESADAGPSVDWGPINPTEVIDADDRLVKLGRKMVIISFASSPTGYVDEDSPTVDRYTPTFRTTIRLKKRVRARGPMAILVAISAPSAAIPEVFGTGAQEWIPSSANTWDSLKYLRQEMLFARSYMKGATEAGAETPFHDVAMLVQATMEQTYEETDGAFVPSSDWDVYAKGTGMIEVPGDMSVSLPGGF